MFIFPKKSIKKTVTEITADISSIENIKIGRIKKKGDKYEFYSVSGKYGNVKFLTYYQGLLKKGNIVSVIGNFNQTKFSYGDYDFYVKTIKINLIESFKNIYSMKKEFEVIYNYLSENNISLEKLKDLVSDLGKNNSKKEKMEDFIKVFEAQTVYDQLSLLGIDDRITNGLYFKYKDDAFEILKANPYILIKDFGIDIKDCDQIARKVGSFEKMDIRRIVGVLYEIFRIAKKEGSSYLYLDEIKERLTNFIENKKEIPIFTRELDYLSSVGDFVNIGDKYFLSEIYKIEDNIGKILNQRNKTINYQVDIEKIINEKFKIFKEKNGFELNETQKKALRGAITNQLFIITGGPGTGKTTIQSVIYDIMSEIIGKDNILMMAPTGIAAKNISKKVGAEAKTIHSAVGINPFGLKNSLDYEIEDKLDVKCVIIDESSMVSTDILLQILKSLKRTTQIILVGDADQLFSIDYGQVLSDIINSNKIPFISLNEGFRFGGSVLVNAGKIRCGESDFIYDDDFMFAQIDGGSEEKKYNNLYDDYRNGKIKKGELNDQKYILDKKYEEEYTKRLKKAIKRYMGKGISIENIKVLTPFNKFFFGVEETNKIIGGMFKDDNLISVEKYSKIFKVGDIVVNTLNNKELGIMNGDNGIIKSIYEDYAGKRKMIALEINFSGEIVIVKGANIKHISHSYCLTIHKSQGSGFSVVIIPLFDAGVDFYNRKLLYTAITRSQGRVAFIGKKELIKDIIDNNLLRNSNLTDCINKYNK